MSSNFTIRQISDNMKIPEISPVHEIMSQKENAHAPSAEFGAHIRKIRKSKGLVLQDVSDASGLAVSTISKIENSNLSPTYDVLLRLARGLSVDLSRLFNVDVGFTTGEAKVGRLAVTRAAESPVHHAGTYIYQPIANQLKNKLIDATVVIVTARETSSFNAPISHEGEELVFVLSGSVELHSNIYEPIALDAGDSVYYDALMEHAFISTSKEDARILNIVTGASLNK